MNKDTKQTLFTFAKRAAFLFSVAFLIFSCDSDDDNFDCENLQANFGEACDSAGVISTDCICITAIEDDSTGTNIYDCPDLMMNIGDECWAQGADTTIVGVITADCECDAEVQSSYDCPELMQNFGDSCATWTPDSVYVYGIIDMSCECN